jgi:hypothetical protein
MAKSHAMCPLKHQLPEPLRQRGFAVYRGKTHDKGGLFFPMVHGNGYPNLFTLHPLPPIPSHCFLLPSFRPHTTVYSHLSDAESTTKFFLHVFPPPIAPLTVTTNPTWLCIAAVEMPPCHRPNKSLRGVVICDLEAKKKIRLEIRLFL